jgi:uncharacterized protein YdeI (YjbR/CyaY-like superfamily)
MDEEATHFATPGEFRAWLEKHHADAEELVVGFHKVGSGTPSITWPEAVDQALCFGWIDGIRRGLDETTYSIRFTPRKKRSIWSARNIGRVEELTRLGLMTPAGVAAFEARSPERSGVYSFEQGRAAKLDPAYERELKSDREAWGFFNSQPPWYRRAVAHWVMSAKREDTRRRRMTSLIQHSANGEPVPPLVRRPAPKRR